MRFLMGIDNGGTMTKAAIFDIFGREIATASQSTPLIVPKEGYNERDMLALWEATVICIREAIEKAGIDQKDIVGIGCTGHGKGLYLWGKDGKPAYNAIASTDRRAVEYIQKWNQDGTARKAREKTLQPVIECQPVALLAWLYDNHPEVIENTKWIFEAKDFIRFMLTGEAGAEVTDYSGTCLMNLKTMTFDKELLELFGLGSMYDCLPPICQSYELCGTITEEISRKTGLCVGTPVCGGMFDIDACAIAMDVSTSDKLCTITGTWSINEYISRSPVPSDTTTHNSLFCIPGYYLIEESSPTSAGNLEWYLQNFMKWEAQEAKLAGRSLYKEVDELVGQLPPVQSEVIFLPFLYGTNTDKCDNAAFVGLSNYHNAAHMLRAIFEGVVFSHYYHIEKLLALRKPPQAIRLAGGAANSAVWVQMFADVINIPVEVVATKELGALGCAMSAAVAAGIYPDYLTAARAMVNVSKTVLPNGANTDIYREKYKRYKRLIQMLGEL